jgi:caa(3)-type oxidase subunit IV
MHDDVGKHVRRYIAVFVALMVGTLVTVGVSQLHLAVAAGITVALLIAIFKGSLVASVFMHLADEKKAIYAMLILTAVLFVGLMLLPVLAYLDRVRY